MSELIYCPICRDYSELVYQDDEIISEHPCKCPKKNIKVKPLDIALNKLKGILNDQSKNSKFISKN